jgi:hypothetical protein
MNGKQHCASRLQLPAGPTHEAAHAPFDSLILPGLGPRAPEQQAAPVVHSAPLEARAQPPSGSRVTLRHAAVSTTAWGETVDRPEHLEVIPLLAC